MYQVDELNKAIASTKQTRVMIEQDHDHALIFLSSSASSKGKYVTI